ncbi:hypothetical protein ASZ80_02196 [Vibrio cholerae]|nr:hypothetical protein ASZ80_02196 [Vibrio cholerae]EGS66970.1 hypothetical protein VCHE09_3150 [Vibrio paracholerae HE-09]KKP15150.1 hypothetical protein VS84_01378 [Vibrio cholerae]
MGAARQVGCLHCPCSVVSQRHLLEFGFRFCGIVDDIHNRPYR